MGGAERKSDSYDGRAERTSGGCIYCASRTARVKSKGKGGIHVKPKAERERERESKQLL